MLNVLPQGFRSASQSNYLNILYISGDSTTENSVRLATTEDGIAKVQKLQDSTWQDTGMRLSGDSLYLGNDLSVSALGSIIGSKSTSSNLKRLWLSNTYDDTGSGEITIPNLSSKNIKEVIQSDDSSSVISKSFGYTFFITNHTILDKIYYKIGTVTPETSELSIMVYSGVDDTGDKYFEQKVPNSDITANSELEIVLNGGLGYVENQHIFVKITSDEDFEIVTDAVQTSPWRAYDYWDVTYDSSVHAPLWYSKVWNETDYCINEGILYECNVTGMQTGTFETNSSKWNKVNSSYTHCMTYKGGITVAEFNALSVGNIGDLYRFTDTGTLVGGETINVGDTAILNKTLSATITGSDYDYFLETINSDVFYQSGRSGGQTASGGTNDGENLVITSTSHANKGLVTLGDLKYDESKNIIGLGSNPDTSAVATLTSTDKGFLPPRMTESERDLIVAPAIGLIIYQTNNSPGLYYYDGAWKPVNRPVGFDEMVYLTHVTQEYQSPYDGVSIQAVTRWDIPVRIEQRIEIFRQYRMISEYLNGFEVLTRPNVSHPEYPYYDSIKCNVPGLYKISYDLSYDNDKPKSRVFVQMTVNDTVVANSIFDFESLYALASNHISTVIQLNAGDVIDVRLGGFINEYCTINSDHLDIIRIK